jgi:hypothetical protein
MRHARGVEKRIGARVERRTGCTALLARIAQAPVLLEPGDVRQLPERQVHDRDAGDLERPKVEVRVIAKRAGARVLQRLGQPLAFV